MCFHFPNYTIDFSINGLSTENRLRAQRTSTPYKIKVNLIGDKNRVNSSSFNATILKFSEKFDHPFSHLSIFGNTLNYCSSAADTHLKLLDRAVSGARILTGGVFECNISHRRSVAVLCML